MNFVFKVLMSRKTKRENLNADKKSARHVGKHGDMSVIAL